MSATTFTRRPDAGTKGPAQEPKLKGFHRICIDDVECEDVRWLWFPYIPAGKLTLIEGDPGIGKSWISCAIAKAIAGGEALPGQEGHPSLPPQRVLLASAEDGLADTIAPRLRAMGANLKMIDCVEEPFTLDKKGIERLELTIQDAVATIVFIDPIVAYLGGKVDMNHANEVRDVMAPLSKAAEHTGCAIVAIRHLRKAGGKNGLYRGIGSIDFTAAVRSVVAVEYGRDGKTKLFRHIKHNLTPAGPTLSFYMDSKPVLNAEGKESGLYSPGEFHWGPAFADDEYGPAPGVNKTTKARAKAQEFLIGFLKDGPKPALDVIRAAEAAGFTETTLKRAKTGIAVSDKELNQWVWRLTGGEGRVIEGDLDD